jgi:hypothetical protein
VLGIRFVGVFHAKIIDHETEGDVTGGVFPQVRCVWTRCVSVVCEVADELLVSKDSSLREAVHSFHNLNQHIAIVNQVQEFVLGNGGAGGGGYVDTHVFPDSQWRPKVKVLKVENGKAPILGGDCAIEEHLGSGHFGCGHAYFARIVDQVPVHSETHIFDLSFVRELRCHTPCVCGHMPGGQLVMMNVMHGLRAFRHV